MSDPVLDIEGIRLFHGDARELMVGLIMERRRIGDPYGTLVVDPPYDQPELIEYIANLRGAFGDVLVFTDPRWLGRVVELFGAPVWLFVWDTVNTWNAGANKPLARSKLCLWYSQDPAYNRDGYLYGDPPPAKHHPGTRFEPAAGRRLADVWTESLRWLHHPAHTGAGIDRRGKLKDGTPDRFTTRQAASPLRHAKPVGWLTCLLGNATRGRILDPFAGSGTTLEAARALGREADGIELDLEAVDYAKRRLSQGILFAPNGGTT